MEKEIKVYKGLSEEEYTKEFSGGITTFSRRELEELPCPFYTSEVSDETMQDIIDLVDAEVERTFGSTFTNENETHWDFWFKEMENECVRHNIPYYEDLIFDD